MRAMFWGFFQMPTPWIGSGCPCTAFVSEKESRSWAALLSSDIEVASLESLRVRKTRRHSARRKGNRSRCRTLALSSLSPVHFLFISVHSSLLSVSFHACMHPSIHPSRHPSLPSSLSCSLTSLPLTFPPCAAFLSSSLPPCPPFPSSHHHHQCPLLHPSVGSYSDGPYIRNPVNPQPINSVHTCLSTSSSSIEPHSLNTCC